ncbi:MAG: Gfo/Idh/MocA family oxidoreductase [Candidatus Neomarinimicrobiota bacterium]
MENSKLNLNPKSKIPIGVIGVGHLGRHHVKHYSLLQNASLIGIYDQDQERAALVSKQYGTPFFSSLNDLLAACEAVSIVTPTPSHGEVAEICISAGKHVFIEKPITKSVQEADSLINLANKKGVLIQVGHIERLNPALLTLERYALNPKFIEVQRLAPYTSRGTDVPVVLDLMIHDIDILMSLVKSPVKHIHASGVSIMTNSVDIANARLRFENGTVASITSSRIAKDKVRKIKIFQKDMYVTIDFLLGLTEVYRVMDAHTEDSKALFSAPLEANGKLRQIQYEKPPVKKTDALKMELENFLESINGTASPIVDGKAGRDALDLALKIHDLILEDLH